MEKTSYQQFPCVQVKRKELMSLKGTNTVADYCERIKRIQIVNYLLK